MADMFHALGIKSHIQQEAVQMLSGTARGFMRSDLFRGRLIKALSREGITAIFLAKINAEIEVLVEQQLLVRRVKRGIHEIGLNKIVWKVPLENIISIREATTIVMSGFLFPPTNFSDVVESVKIQLRKMKMVSRSRAGNAAFEILVARYSCNHLKSR